MTLGKGKFMEDEMLPLIQKNTMVVEKDHEIDLVIITIELAAR